jgi:Ser/Thr protein kinase RdoA (MazF antagonist)
MMKLKYLYDNRDLAEMVLKNWDYDQNKLNLLNFYRISANAVYPFEFDSKRYFLRFSPIEERTAEIIQAELDFLHYLRFKGYPVAATLLSKKGKELEYVETPWGDYLAVVFKGVPGKALSRVEFSEDLILGCGQALGKLHELSQKYLPFQYKRLSWREQLDWIGWIMC